MTNCDFFRFWNIKKKAPTLHIVPTNTGIDSGSVTEVKFLKCCERSVILLFLSFVSM